jgi:SPP1 family predicted phage head-tail adaptor
MAFYFPRIGEMDRQVSLQYKTKVSDSQGNFTETWVTAATVWAKVSTLRSTEAILAMAETGTSIHSITIRYRTDILTSWRIKYGDRYFAIIGPPIDIDMKHKFLDIKCKEAR